MNVHFSLNKNLGLIGILLGSLMVVPSANAAYSWTFTGSGDTCPTAGCVKSSTVGGKTITNTATGWYSNTGSSASIQKANKLRVWDGLAVEATSSDTKTPQHATDNDGWYDSVLFDFGGDKVALDKIVMGWHEDSDFSLLRYTGNDTPVLTGQSYSDLNTTGGWELVSNYFYGGSARTGDDLPFNVNADNKSSSYWLVAALNPAYWGNSNYIGNDYFKVKTLSGAFDNTCTSNCNPPGQVPAPATLMLLGFGLPLLKRRVKEVC